MVQTHSIKNKIIIIGGPTAIGKSAFAIECAKKFNGEIISADSMQIYKGLDIGTGKVTPNEMQGITHHLIDIVSLEDRYSAGAFLLDCENKISEILSLGKLPIIAGGTGLYINALINGMNFSDTDKSETVREKWKNILSQNGNEYIYNHLREIDPISAEKISINDTKRIIRAIEIFEVTGKPKSQIVTTSDCKYDYLFLVLDAPRADLYSAINKRVDQMFSDGLYEEALALIEYKNFQSMQAIGYKQIYEYIDGKYPSLEIMIEEIKKLTRNYAKRQLTFFRGIKGEKLWLQPNEKENALTKIQEFLSEE